MASKAARRAGSTLAATSANGVTVTVNARNVAGSADPVKFTITVQALNPRTVQTTFNGLVDRDPVAADNGNLGGALTNLVVTPTGAYTGVLSLGNLPAIRFSGQLVVPNVGDNPTSTAILIGLLLPAVQKFTLDFTIDASTGKLTGTLQKFGDMARPTPVTAWGNPYSAVHPNAGLAGLHNFWMDPPAKGSGGSVSPGGASVGTATISAHGVVAVYVSMGDGSVFPTFTTTIGMNGEVPLHGILYKGKGSFHGSLAILDTNDVSLPPLAYHTVTGSVSWNKTGATGNADHTYAAGFDFGATNTDLLTVAGSEQEAESGVIFWGIPDVDSPVPNAMITFSGGGITDSAVLAALNASFHIITGAGAGGGPHVLTNFDIIVAAGAGGGPHVKRSLTLNNVTGAINGTFTLTDVLMGPTGVQTVQRTATFTGVVAPGLRLGHGFFTLVQLPGTATSDVFSGPFDFVAVQSK